MLAAFLLGGVIPQGENLLEGTCFFIGGVKTGMSVKSRCSGAKPLKMPTAEAVAALLPLLKSDKNIIGVYLFGSRASDLSNNNSDIDVAFYTGNGFTWDAYYKLYGEVTLKLRSDMIDLVWLNAADQILAFQAIKYGRILYCADAQALNEFELKQKKSFYDYALYLNAHAGKHCTWRDNGLQQGKPY